MELAFANDVTGFCISLDGKDKKEEENSFFALLLAASFVCDALIRGAHIEAKRRAISVDERSLLRHREAVSGLKSVGIVINRDAQRKK